MLWLTRVTCAPILSFTLAVAIWEQCRPVFIGPKQTWELQHCCQGSIRFKPCPHFGLLLAQDHWVPWCFQTSASFAFWINKGPHFCCANTVIVYKENLHQQKPRSNINLTNLWDEQSEIATLLWFIYHFVATAVWQPWANCCFVLIFEIVFHILL